MTRAGGRVSPRAPGARLCGAAEAVPADGPHAPARVHAVRRAVAGARSRARKAAGGGPRSSGVTRGVRPSSPGSARISRLNPPLSGGGRGRKRRYGQKERAARPTPVPPSTTRLLRDPRGRRDRARAGTAPRGRALDGVARRFSPTRDGVPRAATFPPRGTTVPHPRPRGPARALPALKPGARRAPFAGQDSLRREGADAAHKDGAMTPAEGAWRGPAAPGLLPSRRPDLAEPSPPGELFTVFSYTVRLLPGAHGRLTSPRPRRRRDAEPALSRCASVRQRYIRAGEVTLSLHREVGTREDLTVSPAARQRHLRLEAREKDRTGCAVVVAS